MGGRSNPGEGGRPPFTFMEVVMAWATAEDVQALTGKVVEDSDIQQATGIVELTSGGRMASLDSTVLSARNLDWLRRAVAYQAAWMVEHPDYFSRDDVTSVTQDGASATFKADGLVLAPLARRCLKRLSWRGMRTLQPSVNRTADRYGYGPDLPGAYTSDTFDDSLKWTQNT